jgi:DNA-directed RNA polymerase alpha subunit
MDRFDQAKEMRDAGMKLREIGEVLGVSKSRAGSLVAAAERRIKYYTKPDRPVYIKDLLLRIRTSNCLGNEGLWDVKIEDFFETVDAGELLRVPNFGPTSLKDLCLAMLTKKAVTKTAMREWLKTARYVPIKTWGVGL